jgi:hypothetical protein
MMPTIKTAVTQATYDALVGMRKKEGLPSVSALFLKKTVGLTDEMEADEIVRRALTAAKARKTGESFRLRDLFPNRRWEKFSKGARLRAGRAFHARTATATDGIRIGAKSASNHQLYIKG